MLIKSKKQFYELSSRGLCGNAPMVWWSLDEFLSSHYKPKQVTIRSLTPNSSFHKPVIKSEKLSSVLKNVRDGTYIINEIPNDGPKRLIQGEFTWVNGEYYFYCTERDEPMRSALEKDGKHLYGKIALCKVKNICTPSDFRDLMLLFEMYSYREHYPVIELTVFDSCVGVVAHRNTWIWEIRSY